MYLKSISVDNILSISIILSTIINRIYAITTQNIAFSLSSQKLKKKIEKNSAFKNSQRFIAQDNMNVFAENKNLTGDGSTCKICRNVVWSLAYTALYRSILFKRTATVNICTCTVIYLYDK